MTVAHEKSTHVWASAFCPICEKIVSYQATDVEPFFETSKDSRVPTSAPAFKVFIVMCPCTWRIEIGRRSW